MHRQDQRVSKLGLGGTGSFTLDCHQALQLRRRVNPRALNQCDINVMTPRFRFHVHSLGQGLQAIAMLICLHELLSWTVTCQHHSKHPNHQEKLSHFAAALHCQAVIATHWSKDLHPSALQVRPVLGATKIDVFHDLMSLLQSTS